MTPINNCCIIIPVTNGPNVASITSAGIAVVDIRAVSKNLWRLGLYFLLGQAKSRADNRDEKGRFAFEGRNAVEDVLVGVVENSERDMRW